MPLPHVIASTGRSGNTFVVLLLHAVKIVKYSKITGSGHLVQ